MKKQMQKFQMNFGTGMHMVKHQEEKRHRLLLVLLEADYWDG